MLCAIGRNVDGFAKFEKKIPAKVFLIQYITLNNCVIFQTRK